MNVIGIESSCDETSVAVISNGKVLSNLVASQDIHKIYGGVVPELSSRAHLQMILPLVKKAIQESNIQKDEIDIVSATAGPGLIGALLVGLTFAKGFAYSLNRPFIPVNHIEGHIFSGFLMEEKPQFPFLCLVVSGGHTLLLYVESDLKIKKLGSTIDDAAGEAFDKVSKLIGLGYPGGPLIQKYAEKGYETEIKFPIARLKSKYDFSFSGVKTSVLRFVQKEYGDTKIPENDLANIAYAFQNSVVDALSEKVELALNNYSVKSLTLVGGVAANKLLREKLYQLSNKYKISFIAPAIEYCGDNAAMIAYRGQKLYEAGLKFDLNYNVYPSLNKNTFIEE
ncbi:tRNA (adenosine(37)-N6)-threonylcarbamoyltransferase complex transferase subunit TsaD [Stygiobacter electus]|uniref:tRNA N6-adenosine threonylcarbamoyltransferase n=1 Tax=Stygiobacter electus TaxID=3032292 RepID=A0AAE3P162_9BACT|nr:tRNA (adenosine(37)-N6)-threonylcarbamoyltransferase complex transferase subunit TsaD [Stygiobacter electus]MDF1612424.1 tRNA (adenosine(37)-N6)-threonylcarbamoyltransferase complex transferase subunit TsaD [Stygiobacter electus]